MGLIDARSIFMRARKKQDLAEAAQAKKARRDKAVEPKAPTSRKERKRAAKAAAARAGLAIPEHQEVCLHAGCTRPGPFRYGLCHVCYDSCVANPAAVQVDEHPEAEGHPDDIPQTTRSGERTAPLPENVIVVGDTVIVSEAYPNRKYRGLYALVRAVEDEGAVVSIELTGESDDLTGSAMVAALKGFTLRLPATWLLRVEE